MNIMRDSFECMETNFDDILTASLCNTLVSQFITYILYHKQQLPYTFEQLKYVVTKKNTNDTSDPKPKRTNNTERLFKIAKDGLETLELLFEKTEVEMSGVNHGKVSEIAILLGGTLLTPKQVYRIHLPDIASGHFANNHPARKNLLKLLHCIIDSSLLNKMLTAPMSPTNMFLLLRKSGATGETHSWFHPKNRYRLPTVGQHFHIRFTHSNDTPLPCTCQGFTVYQDEPHATASPPSPPHDAPSSLPLPQAAAAEWYQASAVFKGFKTSFVSDAPKT